MAHIEPVESGEEQHGKFFVDPPTIGYGRQAPHEEGEDRIGAAVYMSFSVGFECPGCGRDCHMALRLQGPDSLAVHLASMTLMGQRHYGVVGFQAAMDRANAEVRHKMGAP